VTVRCIGAPDGHLLRVTIPDAVLIQFDLLRMSKVCSKHVHVEDCNKCIINLCIKLVMAKVTFHILTYYSGGFIVQGVQLKSGPYFNMHNLFTRIYNTLCYTTNLYLQ